MDYPSNNKSTGNNGPKREKRIDVPVIEGKVIPKKPSIPKRIANIFIEGDPKIALFSSAKDVLRPGIQKIVLDTLKQSLDRIFLGDATPVRRDIYRNVMGTFGSGQPMVQYNQPVVRQGNPGAPQRSLTWQQRANHDFDQVILETREDVAQVIGALEGLISQYGVARVADLYDALGVTADFTDHEWGWMDLTGAGSRYETDGYLLVLPKPVPLANN